MGNCLWMVMMLLGIIWVLAFFGSRLSILRVLDRANEYTHSWRRVKVLIETLILSWVSEVLACAPCHLLTTDISNVLPKLPSIIKNHKHSSSIPSPPSRIELILRLAEINPHIAHAIRTRTSRSILLRLVVRISAHLAGRTPELHTRIKDLAVLFGNPCW